MKTFIRQTFVDLIQSPSSAAPPSSSSSLAKVRRPLSLKEGLGSIHGLLERFNPLSYLRLDRVRLLFELKWNPSRRQTRQFGILAWVQRIEQEKRCYRVLSGNTDLDVRLRDTPATD